MKKITNNDLPRNEDKTLNADEILTAWIVLDEMGSLIFIAIKTSAGMLCVSYTKKLLAELSLILGSLPEVYLYELFDSYQKYQAIFNTTNELCSNEKAFKVKI